MNEYMSGKKTPLTTQQLFKKKGIKNRIIKPQCDILEYKRDDIGLLEDSGLPISF